MKKFTGNMLMPPDFNREVYCILGLPFDKVNMAAAVQQLFLAAANRRSCFLSTPNLNFLIASQTDAAFRQSVINSDLSVADGMPIVWIARLLGIPIRERVSGSNLFEQLRNNSTYRLSVYFFGGIDGVAEIACQKLNATSSGLECKGYESPGFASVKEMSSQKSIEKINASGADFLVISLGAKKGQEWIEHNRSRITVPILSHLGAVVNFVAGKLERAPNWIQRSGLEWLWRIKEEPTLWKRYTNDGRMFLKLLFTRVLPYALIIYNNRDGNKNYIVPKIDTTKDPDETIIHLIGAWRYQNLLPLREYFHTISLTHDNIKIDMSRVTYVDAAFIGLLMLLYGDRIRQGKTIKIRNTSKYVNRIFKYSCAEFLLE